MTIRISRSWQAGTSRLNPALGHWPKDSGYRVWAILVLVAVLIQGFAVWDVLAATPGILCETPVRVHTGLSPRSRQETRARSLWRRAWEKNRVS